MEGKDIKDFAIGAAVIIGVVALVSILNKAGLIGSNKDQRAAAALKRMPEFRETEAAKIIARKLKGGLKSQQVKDRFAPAFPQIPRIAEAIASSHKPFNWKDLLALATPVTWPLVDADDDEQRVYGAFSRLQTTLDLALLSFSFNRQYKLSLINFLAEWMSAAELAEVYNIVSQLKKV